MGPPLKPSKAGQERINTPVQLPRNPPRNGSQGIRGFFAKKSWDLSSRNKGGVIFENTGILGLINDGWLMIVSILWVYDLIHWVFIIFYHNPWTEISHWPTMIRWILKTWCPKDDVTGKGPNCAVKPWHFPSVNADIVAQVHEKWPQDSHLCWVVYIWEYHQVI